ncbi:MAG: sugar phosphate isomerase/epimerase [Verrucomicrobia bacterium]|nr:sugar phosphate isomerase/epimerase [Verrucomicrobiota bacterium]MDA1087337.1 sugar phosphate isomerase/epimerase [Verrucomicrobiota bacterium]
MSKTRTGGYTIGFRLGWSDWQKDIGALLEWATDNDIGAVDLGRDGDTVAPQVIAAGLRVGSVDLAEWEGMISGDAAKRSDAVAKNAEYVKACAAHGPVNHFIVMLPESPERPRNENFGFMVESFSELAPVLEAHDARIVIEGWPGAGALCCTPEGYREFFAQCPSTSMGVNYDPSHLIRMGIDPLRFLREFAERVYHVHGKDTELFPERLYDLGNEQPPTFAKSFGFGGSAWRYTIPGQGIMGWGEAFRILEEHAYSGCVCIELEDENFNITEATEKQGLLLGVRFLEGC